MKINLNNLLTNIDSMFALHRGEALKEAKITHILSVLNLPMEEKLLSSFRHLKIEAEDVDDEDLLQHIDTTNTFIKDGLDSGGGVLVHW